MESSVEAGRKLGKVEGPLRVDLRRSPVNRRRPVLAELLDQPFRDAAPGPILSGRRRGQDLDRQSVAFGHIDAQARQAGARRLRARVVDANIAGEAGDVPLVD